MFDSLATTVILFVMGSVASVLVFRCFRNNNRNIKNGTIEIKFTEINEGEEANTTKYTSLTLEIGYRLIKGARRNKEETAILINELVRNKCKLVGFGIRDNKKTLKYIKEIMEIIKPLLPRETDSELTATNYRISEKIIPNWGKVLTLS